MLQFKRVKSDYAPPKIIVANTTFMHLIFLCKYKNHILDFYFLFEIYWIRFRLKTINSKQTPINIGELQHMKYICDETVFVIKYEKLHTYFKTKVVGGNFW
jgi:hypothetical protein